MDWPSILETAFLTCFWAGLGFTLLTAIFSGAFHQEFGSGSAFEGGHATELGGADIETGHFHSGQPHVGWSDNAFPGASPLSPTVLAAALTGFGAVGYMSLVKWDTGGGWSVTLGIVGSLFLGGLTFLGMHLMFTRMQSSSHVSTYQLIGAKTRVFTTIEPGQAGAISLEAQGSRMTVPARAEDASRIPAGAEVEIRRVDGGVYVVLETRESWMERARRDGTESASR